MSPAPQGFLRPLLFLHSGPIIWFAHFSLVYGIAGFGGALGVAPDAVRRLAWAATLAAGAAIMFMLVLARKSRVSGHRQTDAAANREMTRDLAALALVAVLLEAAALWMIPV
ncbi:MAG: hypothetical protein M3N38_03925 [Pseudomonadota bacterium]|nr:hypothetical protein [Pseudomonadota bacterium]